MIQNLEIVSIKGNFLILKQLDSADRYVLNMNQIIKIQNGDKKGSILVELSSTVGSKHSSVFAAEEYIINISFEEFIELLPDHNAQLLEKLDRLEKLVSELGVSVEYAPGKEISDDAKKSFESGHKDVLNS